MSSDDIHFNLLVQHTSESSIIHLHKECYLNLCLIKTLIMRRKLNFEKTIMGDSFYNLQLPTSEEKISPVISILLFDTSRMRLID